MSNNKRKYFSIHSFIFPVSFPKEMCIFVINFFLFLFIKFEFL